MSFLILKILKIYVFAKNPSNPTIARIIAKPTPILKIIVPPFPPDDAPSFILNSWFMLWRPSSSFGSVTFNQMLMNYQCADPKRKSRFAKSNSFSIPLDSPPLFSILKKRRFSLPRGIVIRLIFL